MPIRIVCAWCGKPMGVKLGDSDLPVTHGICQECADKFQHPTDPHQPDQQKKEEDGE